MNVRWSGAFATLINVCSLFGTLATLVNACSLVGTNIGLDDG